MRADRQSSLILSADQVLPVLRANVDFFVVHVGDDPSPVLMFERCPSCGRTRQESDRLRDGISEMTFEHPALPGGEMAYLMHTRCARRIAGQSPRASALSNDVAKSVLGAAAAMARLAGLDPVVLVVDHPAALAPGSVVPS